MRQLNPPGTLGVLAALWLLCAGDQSLTFGQEQPNDAALSTTELRDGALRAVNEFLRDSAEVAVALEQRGRQIQLLDLDQATTTDGSTTVPWGDFYDLVIGDEVTDSFGSEAWIDWEPRLIRARNVPPGIDPQTASTLVRTPWSRMRLEILGPQFDVGPGHSVSLWASNIVNVWHQLATGSSAFDALKAQFQFLTSQGVYSSLSDEDVLRYMVFHMEPLEIGRGIWEFQNSRSPSEVQALLGEEGNLFSRLYYECLYSDVRADPHAGDEDRRRADSLLTKLRALAHLTDSENADTLYALCIGYAVRAAEEMVLTDENGYLESREAAFEWIMRWRSMETVDTRNLFPVPEGEPALTEALGALARLEFMLELSSAEALLTGRAE